MNNDALLRKYGFNYARNEPHLRRLTGRHLDRTPNFEARAEILRAAEISERRLQQERDAGDKYERRFVPKGSYLHRRQFWNPLRKATRVNSADVMYFFENKAICDSAKAYGLRKYKFATRRRLKLFVMSVRNLKTFVKEYAGDEGLERAVAGMTGVGLRAGNAYPRAVTLRDMATKLQGAQLYGSMVGSGIVHVAGKMLPNVLSQDTWKLLIGALMAMYKLRGTLREKRRREDILEVHTTGYLTKSNYKTGTYASKALALEMMKKLRPLGYDGWVFEPAGPAVRVETCTKFHPEIMLWKPGDSIQHLRQ